MIAEESPSRRRDDRVDLDPSLSFAAALAALTVLDPHAPAVTDSAGTLTRREIDRRTNRLARAYAAYGVEEGSYVTLVLPNTREMIEAALAVWKLGATPQPLSPKLAPRELAAIVDLVDPSLVVGVGIAGRESLPLGFEPDPALSDDALPDRISLRWKAPASGGSTGRPKVIVADQPAILASLLPLADAVRIAPGSATLLATPLSHNAAFLFGFASFFTGGHIVVMPKFDAVETLRQIEGHRIQWTCLVPTMLHRIARLPDEIRLAADLTSLDVIATGAALCPVWLKEFYVDWLGPDRMLEFFSATEVQAVAIADGHDWIARPDSVGKVVIGEVSIRDEQGEPAAEGEIGELWMRRGDGVPAPYFYLGSSPQRRPGGWESVGDMGWIRDGYIHLADRKADMAVVGGSNVFPAEIEGALEEHPSVISSCVVGIPDDEYGNVLHAIVQLSSEVDDAELRSHLAERISPYKIPRTFEHRDSAIRDDAGKVRRAAERARVISERARDGRPAAT